MQPPSCNIACPLWFKKQTAPRKLTQTSATIALIYIQIIPF